MRHQEPVHRQGRGCLAAGHRTGCRRGPEPGRELLAKGPERENLETARVPRRGKESRPEQERHFLRWEPERQCQEPVQPQVREFQPPERLPVGQPCHPVAA